MTATNSASSSAPSKGAQGTKPKAKARARAANGSAKPRRRTRTSPHMPSASTIAQIAVGAATILGAAVVAWQRYRDYRDEQELDAPGAFDRNESFPGNFDQTRAAGPDAMRDNPGNDWDEVDQASDESFPASDPPGSY